MRKTVKTDVRKDMIILLILGPSRKRYYRTGTYTRTNVAPCVRVFLWYTGFAFCLFQPSLLGECFISEKKKKKNTDNSRNCYF